MAFKKPNPANLQPVEVQNADDAPIPVNVVAQSGGGLTDAQLRASAVPVSVAGGATTAKQDTLIGHVDGVESAIGATTDAAVTTDSDGSLSAKLRGLITLLVSLFKSEDAAHSSGDKGVMALAVRNDGGTSLAGADGDYAPLSTDNTGALRVTSTGGGGGGGTEYTEDAAAAANPVGGALLLVREDALAGSLTNADGDNVAARGNNKGEQYVKDTDGAALLTTAVASLSVLDDWDETDRLKANVIVGQAGITAGAGAVAANTPRVTLASDDPAVASLSVLDDWDAADSCKSSGDVAHDAADSGNPQKIGGVARSSEQTAVANGDRVNAAFDLVGKQIVMPYANPENVVNGTGNTTGTGDTQVIAAQGAGVKTFVTTIIVNNTSSTNTFVNLKDGSTTKLVIPAPANSGAIITLPVPLVTTANTALNFASGAGVTTMYVSAVGYKGV